MTTGIRILFLEDDVLDFELVSTLLLDQGLFCEMSHVKNREEFEAAIDSGFFDVVLSDYTVPSYSGFAALHHVRAKFPNLPFILISGTLSEEQAVESLKSGATDYIIKQRLHRLVPAIRRALRESAQKAEHDHAEAALRASQERTRDQAALLDKARDAIILVDMDQQILYWNKSAERIFGWSEGEAVGQHIGAFLVGGVTGGETVLNKLLSESEWRGEIPVQTKTGKKIVVESRWSLMRDQESPRPRGILLINTDVTEKKEIEAQLLRTQRIETIGALSGGIAHDLNNALAPIIMASELLADDVTTESGRRMLEMVRSSGKRCADMVKQILSFSRGAGQGWELLDASKIIEELAQLVHETFPRLITIQTKCESNLTIYGNLTQLHQVLMNLLVNARDAMPRGGTITVRARPVTLKKTANKMLTKPASGPYISIAVSDTGSGIPPEIIERIFEPFFTTKDVGKGTGLGLSTVFSIMKSHNGFLELKSEVGKGVSFELFFPAAAVAEAKPEPPAPPEPMLRAHGEQLLVVDDEAGLLAIVKNTLETYGYRILTASDGLEALNVLEKSAASIDLVLTDWIMPIMSGTELVRRIRAIAPRMGIVIVTGSGYLEAEGLENAHIQGVLQKPYSTEALLSRIREAMGRPVSAESFSSAAS